ncbi:MAG: AlbA family DNA-binding domain-containing protein [Gammaproteobacteria bacterium]
MTDAYVWMVKQKRQRTTGVLIPHYQSQSSVRSLFRQDSNMNAIKREKWTEADVDALPAGEHDYFERKRGQLFTNMGDLLGKLAKTISAMANSGGGYIILGVDNCGTPDGVPPLQGNTPVRDWLEQKIPRLVEYPLADFRVHIVEPSALSRIPPAKPVIVIDIGDSALAPHQCAHGGGDARKYTYYYRQAGRSEPAPHFYLELLRQRLVSPVLEATLESVAPGWATRVADGVLLATRLRFLVHNRGRVAAYKWQLQVTEMAGRPSGREADYTSQPGTGDNTRVDDTILPGCALAETKDFKVLLHPAELSREAVKSEIETLILPLTLGYRLATETSPGKLEHIVLRNAANVEKLTAFILQEITDKA